MAGIALAALMLNCGGGGGGSTPAPPPVPVATSLTTSDATPARGATFTLTPTYSAGTGAINNSVTCPATGVASAPITANWAGARTYTLTVTNTAGVTATKSVTVTPQVVAVGAISPAAVTRTVGTATTFTTTVTGGATNDVSWSATAGTWAANVWTAPATPGPVTITATSVDDSTKTASTTVTVEAVAIPVATSLVASTLTPVRGGTFTLTPTYSAGTGAIDNSVTCPISGVASAPITANWAGARTYTLTVTNTAGVTATKTVMITPEVVSVENISPAAITRTVGTSTIFTATVTGAATNDVTWSATAGTWTGNVWTAPATSANVTITATSVDDSTKTATTEVTVVAEPEITSFTAAKTTITNGTGTTLSYAFTGGTGSIDVSIGAVTTGGTSNISPTVDTTYTLTVTNAAGATDTATVPITVVAPAHITAFTASAATVTPGTTVTLHPEFENGIGTLNQSLGTATNNVDVTSAALTATTTFTLTVTNAAGDAVTQNVTVYVVAGTFTGAGNMSTARSAPTATLLADNSVLIVGGTSGGSLASAEVYSAGTYTPTTGSMAVGRYSHAATRLADGKVLFTGGFDSAALPGSQVLATAEIFNPADGSFTPTTGTMNVARMDHTATLLSNGLVLIAGGTDNVSIKGAELFDPSTGLFTALAGPNAWPAPRTRATHTATLLTDGRVLLAGGYNGPVSGTADIYDPVLNTFTAAGDMGLIRWGHSATLLSDGKVLITGGREGEVDAGNVLASAEIFDPGTNAFSAVVAPMTTAREWHVATLLPNGNVLIAGGDQDETVPGGNVTNLQSAEIYNPVAGTFTPTGNMAAPRINFTATVLPTTGYVLIVGGGATTVTEQFQ